MAFKVGFVGAGNMAGALIQGALRAGVEPSSVGVSDIRMDRILELARQREVFAAKDNLELVNRSDIVVLSVKPAYVEAVIGEILPALEGKALVSIVAGLSVSRLSELVGGACRILRVMPNLPASVGAGATLLCQEHTLTGEEFDYMQTMLRGAGKCFSVSEIMLENATAISGSGPAYGFMMIEAMADAAVLWGVPRDMAYTLSAQSLLGAAEVVLQTGQHPAQLKDAVCSPGGMTIEAVRELERAGFRSAIIEGINACALKGKKMREIADANTDMNVEYIQAADLNEPAKSPSKTFTEQVSLDIAKEPNDDEPNKISTNVVSIYTDGACSGNPGPGGWGVILEYDGMRKEFSGYEPMTTNNRMELFAALVGLRRVTAPCNITLYSDSSYLINAFSKRWLVKWQLNGWKTSDGNDVLNKDLWAGLLDESSRNNVKFVKVKGHSDNELNNRCDELARQEITNNRKK